MVVSVFKFDILYETRFYIIAIVLVPINFSVPRFFEVQTAYYKYDMSINCRFELPKSLLRKYHLEGSGIYISYNYYTPCTD